MTDKIKFCPHCNGCMFDDMMTCRVCGYEYTEPDDDLVPLDAYGDCECIDEDCNKPSEENCLREKNLNISVDSSKQGQADNGISLTIDCGSCNINISISPK